MDSFGGEIRGDGLNESKKLESLGLLVRSRS